MQVALEVKTENDTISPTLPQSGPLVSSALEAMLRVAASEFPGIGWQATRLDAHGCRQPLHEGLEPGDGGEVHGSFGRKVSAGISMPAALRSSLQAPSDSKVRAQHAFTCFYCHKPPAFSLQR